MVHVNYVKFVVKQRGVVKMDEEEVESIKKEERERIIKILMEGIKVVPGLVETEDLEKHLREKLE